MSEASRSLMQHIAPLLGLEGRKIMRCTINLAFDDEPTITITERLPPVGKNIAEVITQKYEVKPIKEANDA